MDEFFSLFKRTPDELRRDRSILETILPSDFIPKAGDFFRMRFATIADRSYMDCIFKCLASQNGGILAEAVLGRTYSKQPQIFTVGDVIFYDANEIGRALPERPAPAHDGEQT